MKWKERVGITVAISVVVVTSVLVIDIRLAQIRSERSGDQNIDPYLVAAVPMLFHRRQQHRQNSLKEQLFVSPLNQSTDNALPMTTVQRPSKADDNDANTDDDLAQRFASIFEIDKKKNVHYLCPKYFKLTS